jgi:hypothetical protein
LAGGAGSHAPTRAGARPAAPCCLLLHPTCLSGHLAPCRPPSPSPWSQASLLIRFQGWVTCHNRQTFSTPSIPFGFHRGSAGQYGEADLQGKDFSGQDLRRSNFTSADCRKANFSGAKLQGGQGACCGWRALAGGCGAASEGRSVGCAWRASRGPTAERQVSWLPSPPAGRASRRVASAHWGHAKQPRSQLHRHIPTRPPHARTHTHTHTHTQSHKHTHNLSLSPPRGVLHEGCRVPHQL